MGKLKMKVIGSYEDKTEFMAKNFNENILFVNFSPVDYLIYLNNEPMDMHDTCVQSFEKENTGILVVKKRKEKQYLASVNIGEYTLYLEIPDNYIVRDEIFLLKGISYTLEDKYHHYRLASMPDVPNVNGYTYLKQEMDAALLDERIQHMMKTNTLGVEFFLSSAKEYPDRFVIDPTNCIGTVIAFGSYFLFIREGYGYSEKDVPKNDNKCIAYMRYVCDLGAFGEDNKLATNIKITTWDIWFSTSLPKEYARDVLGIIK